MKRNSVAGVETPEAKPVRPPPRRIKCTFTGCGRTSERPFADGWGDLAGWGPLVPDDLYCREHKEALELMRDLLDEPVGRSGDA